MAMSALSNGFFTIEYKQNDEVCYVMSSWIFGGNNSDSNVCHSSKCWIFTVLAFGNVYCRLMTARPYAKELWTIYHLYSD